MTRKCAGCHEYIPDRRFLTCSSCFKNYDLECTNVAEKRFYLMSAENKLSWMCPECLSNKPKHDNTNTPIGQRATCYPDDELDQQMRLSNITHRHKTTLRPNDADSLCLDDSPPKGNTISLDSTINTEGTLLSEIRELRAQVTIQSKKQEERDQELSTTIKLLQATIVSITKQNTLSEEELKSVKTETFNNTKRINDLEEENTKLKILINKYIEDRTTGKTPDTNTASYANATPQKQCNKNNRNIEKLQPKNTTNYNKTIVLYGLMESRHETEFELEDRIVNVFYDITGVDLTGYIEEVSRIGRHGNRRPLKVELLSKNTTKCLLKCVMNFRNTGLWLSEYLDENGLRQRKEDRENRRMSKQYYNKTLPHQDNTKLINSTNEKKAKNGRIQSNTPHPTSTHSQQAQTPQDKKQNKKIKPFRE